MPVVTVRLPIEGEYSLEKTLKTLTMGTGNPCLRHTDESAAMTLTTPDGGALVRAERLDDSLQVTADGDGAPWVEPHLPALFGWLDDSSDFAPEGRLGRLAKLHAGLRLPLLPTVFDRLVQIVLQQLITFRDACRGWRRLAQTYGEPVEGAEGLYYPPSARRLARLEAWRYTECDILPKHARVIQMLARQAAGIERLWNAGGDESVTERRERLCEFLLRQRGIGPWTVGYLRGAGLGDADAVVLGDYGHPHHVAYFFTGKERSDDDEMQQLLEPYRPHRFRALMLLILGAKTPPRRGPKRAPLRRRLR